MESMEGPDPSRLPLRFRFLGNLLSSGPLAARVPRPAFVGPEAEDVPVPWRFVAWEWLEMWRREVECGIEWALSGGRYQ